MLAPDSAAMSNIPPGAFGRGRGSNITGSFHAGSQEDIFRALSRSDGNCVSKKEFLRGMERAGLLLDDPRLAESIAMLAACGGEDDDMVTFEQFNRCITPNISLIDRAFQGDFIIPNWMQFCAQMNLLYEQTLANRKGKVADYIPQLSRVDPEQYGISICTIDGQRLNIGDADVEFCIQSCCKPFSYALALEDWGENAVHQHVGREPSGRGFNELVLNREGYPHNPLINAGAIMTTSLLKPQLTIADRFDYVIGWFSRLAGNAKVGFHNATYLSERQTADRNFALGYYMREKKAFPEGTNLKETLEFYFQLCSMEITCSAGACIAATLANGGVCPITGERLLKPQTVRDVLSMMYSCGMYDYSGEFAFSVGLPAKSGVAGAILIVVPNVMGTCVWSPRLDLHGNSVRGVDFCQLLVRTFNFHNYDNLIQAQGMGKIDPRNKKKNSEENALVAIIFAAASGDIANVRRLYLSGVDLNDCDYDGRTAAHLAASNGHAEVLRFLIATSHNFSCIDRFGATPLDDAKASGHQECIRVLSAAR